MKTSRHTRWFLTLGVAVATITVGSTTGRRASAQTIPASPAAPAADAGALICEPVSSCGFWSDDCVLLAVEPPSAPSRPTRYRALSGRGVVGSYYVRRHDCASSSHTPLTCLEYCTGSGAALRCRDGLTSEDTGCSEAALPARAPFECALGASGRCEVVARRGR
ncbi:MAG: hypothetical protein WCJ30_03815 [Deltaproteobacteria bacterium]